VRRPLKYDGTVSLDVTKGFMDCEYAGESAFVILSAGQTATFTVFFANTGTIPWVRSTETQVDLAICRPDARLCDVESPWRSWNPGSWLSPTRYATHIQDKVLPGELATFTFAIKAPPGAAAGIYRFDGELVESASGKPIHPVGYYQAATIGAAAAAATIHSLEPSEAEDMNSTEVRIHGSGFVCIPSPTVLFGGDVAEVHSCSAKEILALTPMRALPAGDSSETVPVVVANVGQASSNALSFTYLQSFARRPGGTTKPPPSGSGGQPGTRSTGARLRRRLSRIISIWGLDE
jgi:hypothetical protein